jgi:hypothetical protein
MMYAPAAVIAAISAACASGSSNIHRCRRPSTPSPNGFSMLWLGPATNPSTDIAMSHVTLLMPIGRSGSLVLDM